MACFLDASGSRSCTWQSSARPMFTTPESGNGYTASPLGSKTSNWIPEAVASERVFSTTVVDVPLLSIASIVLTDFGLRSCTRGFYRTGRDITTRLARLGSAAPDADLPEYFGAPEPACGAELPPR